ncbi:MAG: OmpA family protein [Gammaproteobacteria bacterium]|nr:OmpA family protein [Gammaproteobacteria bacterium]
MSAILMLSLFGCTSVDTPPSEPQSSRALQGVFIGGAAGAAIGAVSTGVTIPVAAAMGGIVGGALAASMVEKRTPEEQLADKLRRDKVQIIRVGEDYMLVLPSENYFYANSSHFNEKMYPAVVDIAQYINQYDLETVKVAGYTDNQGNDYRNIAMSREQAQIVSSLLWMDHVRPSFMYTIGYGSAYPIADNSVKGRQGLNNRVQITFRRLTAES